MKNVKLRRCWPCGVNAEPPHFCARCGICRKTCLDKCKRIPSALPPGAVVWEPGRLNTLSRPIGLEVELSIWGTFKQQRPKHFSYTIDHDGSVKPSGEEAALAPLVGDKFFAGVVELAAIAAASGASVNDTCGLHVHVAASDANWWDMRRLLTLYQQFEEEIFQYFCAPARRQSRHARPLTQTTIGHSLVPYISRLWDAHTNHDLKIIFSEMMYGVEDVEAMHNTLANYRAGKIVTGYQDPSHNWIRYQALNLHSWMHRGTIEWRHKEGTLDLDELLAWPLFCAWFTEVAINRLSDCNVRKVPSLLWFIEEHMPPLVLEWARKRILASRGEVAA